MQRQKIPPTLEVRGISQLRGSLALVSNQLAPDEQDDQSTDDGGDDSSNADVIDAVGHTGDEVTNQTAEECTNDTENHSRENTATLLTGHDEFC